MHLESEIFDLVNHNIKDIEVRINDEKKKKIKNRRYNYYFK